MRFSFLILCSILNLLFSVSSFAQEAAAGGDSFADESFKDMKTILYTGGGGAALGLSTLSFAENPSKRLKNILIGASLGIIIGVIIVAYSQSSKSREQFSYYENHGIDFTTSLRNEFHQKTYKKNRFGFPMALNYRFNF